MSNKFEQLLDHLVNEEMDKANELFHEIVVEKSREIYENLIAEEADEEEMDEASEEEDESVEEESDLDEETTLEIGGDPADALAGDVAPDAPEMGMDMGGEEDPMAGDLGGDMGDGSLEDEVDDRKADFEKLKADFDKLARGEEPGEEDPFAGDDEEGAADDEGDDEEGDDEEGDDEENAMPFAESRLREYTETVSDGHGADKKGRAEDGSTNTKSVGLQNPKGRPTTTASAHNILGQKGGEAGIKGGEGVIGKTKGEFTSGGTHNVNGVKSGIKTLNKVPAGHGPEKKGSGESGANTKSLVDRRQ